jgi:hypothetical protein
VKPIRTILALACFALAGCTADKPPADADGDVPDSPSGTGAPNETPLGASISDPPAWNLGDWWQYRVDYASGESYTAKIIVYAEDGTNYYVTSEDRELVMRSTIQHYPNFGPVEKGTLANWIHGTKVNDFRWPMENGSWTDTYRDSQATWETDRTELPTGNGPVQGFRTAMRFEDGETRIVQGWSPQTKWYTEYAFDFDGIPPVDVTIRLEDWGSNHTGSFPIVELVEGVHRPFPTLVLPPDPMNLPQGESQDTFQVVQDGSSIMWAMFAAAGGNGDFEYGMGHLESQASHSFSWRPTGAASYFAWGEIADAATGEWGVTGTGAAEGSAFLFLEAYEVRTRQGSL